MYTAMHIREAAGCTVTPELFLHTPAGLLFCNKDRKEDVEKEIMCEGCFEKHKRKETESRMLSVIGQS